MDATAWNIVRMVTLFIASVLSPPLFANIDSSSNPAGRESDNLCPASLSRMEVAFGNFRLSSLSGEYSGIVGSFGIKTGRVMFEPGEAALVLYNKDWEFEFQGAAPEVWYSSKILGEVLAKGSVNGSILASANVHDIRLTHKYYRRWYSLLVNLADFMVPRHNQMRIENLEQQSFAKQVNEILGLFSFSQREAVLFAFLSAKVTVAAQLYPFELMTKVAILNAGGFGPDISLYIAKYFMENSYSLDYGMTYFERNNSSPEGDTRSKIIAEAMMRSSRPNAKIPSPLPSF